MRTSHGAMLALGLIITTAGPGRADDQAAVRTLLDKAIRAHGGEANLAKFKAVTAKLKGAFHGLPQAVAFSGELTIQGPEQQRIDLELDAFDQKIRVVHVLNGNKGWNRFGDDTEEMDKEELAEAKEQAYADWASTLIPLKDKAFTLAPLGEIKIDKRPALGIKVSHKDRRDVSLYFDKETHLLVKIESRVKDDDTGAEVTEESFPSDYRDVQGTKQAMKFTIKRDGKLYMEGELSNIKLLEKVDDATFAKP